VTITIRQAFTADINILNTFLAELFAIEKDFKADHAKQKRALEMITGSDAGAVIFMAESGSVPAGMINLQKIVSTASGGYSVLVEDLYVSEQFRGTGIGKKLLERAVQWAREQQALRIQLAADFRNKRAMAFYETNGFSISSMLCHYRML